MKKLFLIIFFSPLIIRSQTSILGEYKMINSRVTHMINLYNDSIYKYSIIGDISEKVYKGSFNVVNDTLILFDNESKHKLKFKIINEYYFYKIQDTILSSDVICVNYIFKKSKSYYSSGVIKQEMSWSTYSSNINTQYTKDRDGLWYYFNEKGVLEKQEKYKNGKLKKVKIISQLVGVYNLSPTDMRLSIPVHANLCLVGNSSSLSVVINHAKKRGMFR